MANHKCEIKTELLAEYMATLEKFKVAAREHKKYYCGERDKGWVQSAKRIEAIKKLCTAARESYTDHCKAHWC